MGENELNFEVVKEVPAWGFKMGTIIPVDCDKNGVPLVAFYRKRVRDKDISPLQTSKTKKKSTSEDPK